MIQGKLHLKPNIYLARFVHYANLNIINTIVKNNISILKQIVWQTQKWHLNMSRPSSSWVINQNMIQYYDWVFQTICFRMLILLFKESIDYFEIAYKHA